MASETPDLQAIMERLEKVEKQNRRLKQAGATVLTLCAAFVLMGQTSPKSRTVEAEEFIVRDANGEMQMVLNTVEGRPFISLYDANTARVVLCISKGPALILRDANGTERASLGLVDGKSVLTLRDANEQARAVLWMEDTGPGLALYDANGTFGVGMLVNKNGPDFTLQDANGKHLFHAPK